MHTTNDGTEGPEGSGSASEHQTPRHLIIREVRDLMPQRPLTPLEAGAVAERQATRLLRLLDVQSAPVDLELVALLPRLEVTFKQHMFSSGASTWEGARWIVAINSSEPPLRQRFTLAHEIKHVLDHPYFDTIYTSGARPLTPEAVERVCDYFAGCFLVPKPWLKQAWVQGVQRVEDLAQLFQVSRAAMQVRLWQTGLLQPVGRHGQWPEGRPEQPRYFRAQAESEQQTVLAAMTVGC